VKSLWRWLWRSAIVLALLLAASIGPDLWPEPFFSYCATQARLSLWSDLSFDHARGQKLLSEAAARLARSPLDDRNEHRIFVSNAAWRVALFMHNSGAAAFSIYPLSRNVFSHHADIGANIAFHATGEAAQPPRTFVYYMTHEFTHALTGEHVGYAQWRQMPAWVKEGYADYVGMGSGGPEDDPGLLYARYRAHDPVFASNLTYYRYRMLVAYFLKDRGWSLDELLASNLTLDQAQRAMDQAPPVNPLK
jgi:hypothetical protein